MPRKIILKFPVELLDFDDQDVINKGKETIVLELLRMGKISQGKAAELLEISRYDLFDLMVNHDIHMSDFPPEELQRQREDMKNA